MSIFGVQSWYISKVNIKRLRSVVGVHDKYVSTLDGYTRVELWWIRGDSCRGLKRHGGLAHCRVLVECEKLSVRNNLDLVRGELRKLHMRPMIEVASEGAG